MSKLFKRFLIFIWSACVIFSGFIIYDETQSFATALLITFMMFAIPINYELQKMVLDAQKERLFNNTDKIIEIIDFLNEVKK